MEAKALQQKVALVTGATRGIGRGIALQLGKAGALVYITGRTLKSKNGMGSLEDTAKAIEGAGGKCVPVQVDHEKDDQIASLFEKINKEQDGKLDLLVNNAYKGVETIFSNASIKFWDTKPEIWDDVNNVGLRNHYICTVHASRMMVPRKQGLIVNISSFGGQKYLFNVAYGIGKSAVDRMAIDCGIELKEHDVTMLSLYPGAVKTELINDMSKKSDKMNEMFENGETVEFAGKCLVSLMSDPDLKTYNSKIVCCADYAEMHGIKDIDGRSIPSHKQMFQPSQDHFKP